VPQARPRFHEIPTAAKAKGGSGKKRMVVYSPSSPKMKAFRATAKKLIDSFGREDTYTKEILNIHKFDRYGALFYASDMLKVRITFHIRRPSCHFYKNKPRKLKYLVPGVNEMNCLLEAGDTDNFVKFTLDALQGVAFEDDKQIIEITARKEMDNDFDGDCMGRTEIFIEKIKTLF
jgi:Holliday junction resolvase RusA-like endonuclease